MVVTAACEKASLGHYRNLEGRCNPGGPDDHPFGAAERTASSPGLGSETDREWARLLGSRFLDSHRRLEMKHLLEMADGTVHASFAPLVARDLSSLNCCHEPVLPHCYYLGLIN